MVTAPGMRAHDIMGADAMLTVTRNGAGVGREGAIGFVAGADKEGWTVASIAGAENSILFSEKNDGIKCDIGAPADKSVVVWPTLTPLGDESDQVALHKPALSEGASS